MKRLSLLLCLFTYTQLASSQMKQDIAAYIEKYKAVALEEMVRCKIPASITLAQGLHESSYGKSKLSTEANNHFGIKCKEEWEGKKFYQNDDAPNECFRVYDHPEDSYADHSDFLITRPRYAGLFELPITDYTGWAKGLKASGYATNPRYAEILIRTIEENNLTQYDQQGLAMIDAKERLFSPNASTPTPTTASIKPIETTTAKQVASVVETEVFNDIKPTVTTHETKVEKRDVAIKTAVANAFTTTKNDAAQKEFVVNGTKAIKATGNIDPLAIAYTYQIQYAQILAFNDMNEGDHFKDGENIFLQPKRARGAEEKYTVLTGESMRDIAQRFGIKLHELYQKNMMAMNDQPMAGETLNLQERRNGAPRSMSYSEYLKTLSASSQTLGNGTSLAASNTDTTPTSTKKQYAHGTTQYTVAPSDTLYSIAKKFNVSIQQLSVLNNLQTADLHPGQTLVIGQ